MNNKKRSGEQLNQDVVKKRNPGPESVAGRESSTNIDDVDQRLFQRDLNRARDSVKKREDSIIPEIKGRQSFESVEDALDYLRATICDRPVVQSQQQSGNNRQFPGVVWRHFLYALFSNQTEVDAKLDEMIRANQIRILSYGSSSLSSEVIVRVDDFVEYFCDKKKKNLLLELFFTKVLKAFTKTKYSLDELSKAGFSPIAVDKFVSLGLLTNTDSDINERQLSFPGLGVLVRALHDGRKALLGVIRKSKHAQAQQNELAKRILPNSITGDGALGLEMHLLDVYGANLVQSRELTLDVLISPTKKRGGGSSSGRRNNYRPG